MILCKILKSTIYLKVSLTQDPAVHDRTGRCWNGSPSGSTQQSYGQGDTFQSDPIMARLAIAHLYNALCCSWHYSVHIPGKHFI